MIFVAVGSRRFQFDRLIRAVDAAALQIALAKEEVFAQIGTSAYTPQYITWVPFLDRSEFSRMITQCDIMIAHAAAGVLLSGLRQYKKVIAVPRLMKYGELIDDHQKELAHKLAEENMLFCMEDLSTLADAIQRIKTHEFVRYTCQSKNVTATIRQYIHETL